MGLKQIILAVSISKENIGWDHYDKIVKVFGSLFKRIGFSENNIRYQLTNTLFLPRAINDGWHEVTNNTLEGLNLTRADTEKIEQICLDNKMKQAVSVLDS